jgi:hypothetical protein
VGGALEIESDDTFRRRESAAESVGWLLLVLVLLAALVGLLGPGPLSAGQARSPSGRVSVHYQRVAHREADDTVTIELARDAGDTALLTIGLGGDWLEELDLRGITPEPSEQVGTPDGLELRIPTSGSGRVRVVLALRTGDLGTTHATVRVGGEDVSFTQFVLP